MTTLGSGFHLVPGVEIADVETAIDREIDKLLADGVTKDELDRAQRRLIDGAIFARDSVSGPARVFGALWPADNQSKM